MVRTRAQASERYFKSMRKHLPTLVYILNQKKLNPKLINKLSPSLIKLIKDLFKNITEPEGFLYRVCRNDKCLHKCRKSMQRVSKAKSVKSIKKELNQNGGIALPLSLLTLAIPHIIGLFSKS